MNETIGQILIYIATAVGGWLSAKILTKREKKKSDIDLISSSTKDLLDGIKELTSQNKELVNELQEEQKKNLELIKEKKALLQEQLDLNSKIDNLEKKVANLTAVIKKFAKEKEFKEEKC
jgi:predicted RNase H-like nuclease (RuvC/YqgF family)